MYVPDLCHVVCHVCRDMGCSLPKCLCWSLSTNKKNEKYVCLWHVSWRLPNLQIPVYSAYIVVELSDFNKHKKKKITCVSDLCHVICHICRCAECLPRVHVVILAREEKCTRMSGVCRFSWCGCRSNGMCFWHGSWHLLCLQMHAESGYWFINASKKKYAHFWRLSCYGVATVSRIDKMIGLFWKILSLLQGSFAKKSKFIDPINRSHPIFGVGADQTACVSDMGRVIFYICRSTEYLPRVHVFILAREEKCTRMSGVCRFSWCGCRSNGMCLWHGSWHLLCLQMHAESGYWLINASQKKVRSLLACVVLFGVAAGPTAVVSDIGRVIYWVCRCTENLGTVLLQPKKNKESATRVITRIKKKNKCVPAVCRLIYCVGRYMENSPKLLG